MSIFKLTGDLAGKTIYYNGVPIRKVSVPEKFSGKIPHPIKGKVWLNEEDLASIICEVLPNKTQRPEPTSTVEDIDDGKIDVYLEDFRYHNESGEMLFSVTIKNGLVEILSITYNSVQIGDDDV